MSHPAFAGRFFVAIGSYSQLHRSFQRLETLGLTFTHVTDKADYALLWFEPGRAAAQQRQVRARRHERAVQYKQLARTTAGSRKLGV